MTSPPSSKAVRALRACLALVLGVAIGVFLHYLLYRYSLPERPFIYVAF